MLFILAVAAAARLPYLDYRPMHADEANQAVKTSILWSTGHYRYDTADHHGPTLYYLTLPAIWLSGAKDFAHTTEFDYRIVPVVFGLAAIAILPLFADGLGLLGVIAAAAFMAVSPAFVYYARYYIQETLLVFFTLAAIGCGWRFVRSRNSLWLIATGAAVGLLHATKETWIFSAVAAACGLATCIAWNRLSQGRWPTTGPYFIPAENAWRGIAAWCVAIAIAALVASALFSGFGDNRWGPWHSITAYASYWHRSGLPEHTEPWYYYLEILFWFRPMRGFFWSEAALAAWAMVGAVIAFCPASINAKPQAPSPKTPSADFGRFLTIYTFALLIIYSAISYKTPWCGLNILCGVILLAGFGVAQVATFCKGKFAVMGAIVVSLSVLVTIAHLGWQAYRLNYRFAADARNPYVYAHPPLSLIEFAERLDKLGDRLPQGHELTIHVIVPESYWPLPWYLRHFNPQHADYWFEANVWKDFLATSDRPDVVLIADQFTPIADDLLGRDTKHGGYNCQMLVGLRPGTVVRVYVRDDLWPAMLR